MAEVGKTRAGYQADIAGSDHCYTH
jgi:hypothetical protein